MSRIITKVKCSHCGADIENLYISFGHPEEDFIWEWECAHCGGINEELIEKMPCMSDKIEEMFDKYCEENNLTLDDVTQLIKNKA